MLALVSIGLGEEFVLCFYEWTCLYCIGSEVYLRVPVGTRYAIALLIESVLSENVNEHLFRKIAKREIERPREHCNVKHLCRGCH